MAWGMKCFVSGIPAEEWAPDTFLPVRFPLAVHFRLAYCVHFHLAVHFLLRQASTTVPRVVCQCK